MQDLIDPPPAIEELLPHQGQMVFLDELYDVDEGHGRARVNMSRLQAFALPNDAGQPRLPSYLALECMVQTVAAMVGLKRRRARQRPASGSY